MPPKAKGGVKTATAVEKEPPPQTIHERTLQRFYQTNPVAKLKDTAGLKALSLAEQKTYAHVQAIVPLSKQEIVLSNKAEREYWKTVAKEGLPLHRLSREHSWGKDKGGRDIGTYTPEEFHQRTLKQARLTALNLQKRQFITKRQLAQQRGEDLTPEEIASEKKRREIMAALQKELYGSFINSLAQDPLWDDVIPIPQNETDGALAQIAYPEPYAECVAYLRAVMAAEECSERALRLTESVIDMNPAHYTVWLYRFKILSHLKIPVPEEIEWLNEVSLSNLKNYQIWHHRQLLMDYYYPQIAEQADTIKALMRSETVFVKTMLAEDTKNYHVWTYRKYLVEKLGMWNVQEMGATQNLIEEDVRNNSAWAHRFFLVFSDPKQSDPKSLPTAADPTVPDAVIDREVNFAKEKIQLAPQNQSSWNYLRGVLTKGGRSLVDFEEFVESFVQNLGKGDEEEVTSSHALDLLAEIAKEKGDTDKAKLCLGRLSEKWDPIRAGYWKFRLTELK